MSHTTVSDSIRSAARWRTARHRLAQCAPALLLAACAAGANEVHQSEQHAFRVVTVVEGLQHPWGIAFLPGGDLLVTERAGRLRVVRGGQLLQQPVGGVPAVQFRGQGGLLDVALHPDFASNRLVYLSYSKPDANGSLATTAVVRGRLEDDQLANVEEVFEARAWGDSIGHYGSRLAFDGNGHLFITIGDRMAPPTGDLHAHPSQDLANHQGTIVRLHDDGRVPEDNPFVGRQGALPEIWSYGHRNQQGLAFHPQTGDLWSNEHGPQGGDELNLVLPGRNYGWPVIGYGVQYGSGARIHEGTHRDGMEQPEHFWVPSIAVSGLMIYDGDAFPQWRGSAFSGGLSRRHQVLSRAALDGRSVAGEELLLDGVMRIRDVRQGPEGHIYIAVDDVGGGLSPIVRLEPAD